MIYNRNLGRSYRLCMPPDAIDHTMNCVKLLGLSFFERDRNRIRCTQFTTNPWEIA